MNDLFGIQRKGGVFDAGQYAIKSIEISDDEINKVSEQIKNYNNELERPGMYRINLLHIL